MTGEWETIIHAVRTKWVNNDTPVDVTLFPMFEGGVLRFVMVTNLYAEQSKRGTSSSNKWAPVIVKELLPFIQLCILQLPARRNYWQQNNFQINGKHCWSSIDSLTLSLYIYICVMFSPCLIGTLVSSYCSKTASVLAGVSKLLIIYDWVYGCVCLWLAIWWHHIQGVSLPWSLGSLG